MKEVYYIGGSPCCGKSTIAEMFEERGFYYYKIDERLYEFRHQAEAVNKPLCSKVNQMNFEEMFMRDPVLQKEEELSIYREIFEFIIKDIENLEVEVPVITEGAALLPELMNQAGIDVHHYVNMVPERNFQIEHYSQRTWVPLFLKDCRQPEEAFRLWMERDVLFAKEVRKQAIELGYRSILVDGTQSIAENFRQVCDIFEIS